LQHTLWLARVFLGGEVWKGLALAWTRGGGAREVGLPWNSRSVWPWQPLARLHSEGNTRSPSLSSSASMMAPYSRFERDIAEGVLDTFSFQAAARWPNLQFGGVDVT